MKKVCCFGEILLRVSPANNWTKNNEQKVFIGGAEANVATALGNWQVPVKYISAMPDNYIGRDIEAHLQSKNIETTAMAWQGNRVGIYYMQQGADLKHAGVIYDRFHSSFYDLKPGDIDWNIALEDVGWFHFTAITPALNQNMIAVCKEALEVARAKDITISVDLNYRAKLWKYGKEPLEVMPELVQYCDVIMGNIWAANTLLGINLDADVEQVNTKENYLRHAAATSKEIQQQYPNCKTIAYTFRFDEIPAGIRYYAAIFNENQLFQSREFSSEQIVDKAGSGDCFMAGLIYGIQTKGNFTDVVNFAAAAAFGKLSETGDASAQTVEDVKKILNND